MTAHTTMNEEQFVEMYREYAPQLFKYCYFRVSSREEAEDLSSQVFMKVWDYVAKGAAIDNMRALLYRIAHNLVVDFYKSAKRTREVPLEAKDGTTIDVPDDASI